MYERMMGPIDENIKNMEAAGNNSEDAVAVAKQVRLYLLLWLNVSVHPLVESLTSHDNSFSIFTFPCLHSC